MSDPRRHDLDALRAAAMLPGIVFHAALACAPGVPWLVRDSQQNVALSVFAAAVHGFRMPLFFLVSGYFTAMLWRQRGLAALLPAHGADAAALSTFGDCAQQSAAEGMETAAWFRLLSGPDNENREAEAGRPRVPEWLRAAGRPERGPVRHGVRQGAGAAPVLLGLCQSCVRYSWLGRLLNGPRRRPGLALADEAPRDAGKGANP
jgi:hypothetical protein